MDILIQNKKVGLDYEIMEKFQAGIKLLGGEVKSLRQKNGSLEGSHVSVRGGEAFLLNSFIPPYQEKNTEEDYDPHRRRTLLMTKEELGRLADLESKKGLTVVPIVVYNNRRKIKIEIAVVKGKKKFDKREDLKKRQIDRDIAREYSDR